jgi:hypothetical protein
MRFICLIAFSLLLTTTAKVRAEDPSPGSIGAELTIFDDNLVVVWVAEGSPAEIADVMVGDVILKIDDFVVNRKVEQADLVAATEEISNHEPGDIIKLTVKRDASEIIMEVRVGTRDEVLKGILTLVITVPEGAIVRVRDKRVDIEGTTRVLTYSVKEPGIVYLVKVAIEFTKDGEMFSETKNVRMYQGRVAKLDVSDIAMPNRKRRTISYWQEVNQIGQDWSKKLEEDKSIEVFYSILQQLGTDIAELPTRGVDEDAINACHELAEAFENMANFAKTHTSNERLMEAFIIGYLGDPLSIANEVAAEEKAIKEKCDAARIKLRRTKALLSSRYDFEFPKLD